MKHWILMSSYCALTLLASTGHAAETLTLAEPNGKFEESLSGRTQVSGRVLVGLRVGPSPKHFDTGNVRVAIEQTPGTKSLCVRMTSSDGRYWSLNRYQAKPPLPTNPRLDIRTRYQEELAEYEGMDIITRVINTKNCQEDAEGLIYPVIHPSLSKRERDLYAYVNTGEARTSMALVKSDDQQLAKTKCARPSNRATAAFTRLCKLNLPENIKSGEYQLVISERRITGRRTKHRFSVWLPE